MKLTGAEAAELDETINVYAEAILIVIRRVRSITVERSEEIGEAVGDIAGIVEHYQIWQAERIRYFVDNYDFNEETARVIVCGSINGLVSGMAGAKK